LVPEMLKVEWELKTGGLNGRLRFEEQQNPP
jgi:hypothetical protein